MTLSPLGDSAVVVTLGSTLDELTLLRVRSLTAELKQENSSDITDIVPAYTTVTVFYEIVSATMSAEPTYPRVCHLIEKCLQKTMDRGSEVSHLNLKAPSPSRDSDAPRILQIPVCYGGDYGPDIDEVARLGHVSVDDVSSLHSGVLYTVHAIGFTPGFPYLAGLPEKLHAPRRATPRIAVPAGSVGIGGKQTGIYPLNSPGGWQLIGRTPQKLFDVQHQSPALLRVGDRVQFRPISAQEFESWS